MRSTNHTTALILATIAILFGAGTIQAQTATETKTTETKTTESQRQTDSNGVTRTTEQITTVSKSENLTKYKNMIAIDPVKFFLFYNLSYYRAILRDPAIVVGGGVALPTALTDNVKGIGVNLEARWYPGGKTLNGFYVSPKISFGRYSQKSQYENMVYDPNTNSYISVPPNTYSSTMLGFGSYIGWQWAWGEQFHVSIGLGADQTVYLNKSDGSQSRMPDVPFIPNEDGLYPGFSIQMGYAW